MLYVLGFPGGSDGKRIRLQCRRPQESSVRSLGQEDPLEKETITHSGILPGEAHGERSLAGYCPWGCKESDMTEWLSTHVVLSTNLNKTERHISIIKTQSIFTALKAPCVLSVPLSHSHPGNHWSFYHLHSFAFSRILYSWNYTIYNFF